MSIRPVTKIVKGRETSDGGGVRLKRSLGGPELSEPDPFLLLDEFRSDSPGDYIAGFPDHPHRGFETVTYMLAGKMEHKDHTGRQGTLTAGSVQWMTAGRGIVHSEMPKQADGLMWGFQLWVNLPSKLKMTDPRYQEFPPGEIPRVSPSEGVEIRVVAGHAHGVSGAVSGIATEPLYLDVVLSAGRILEEPVPAGLNALVYVFEGQGEFGGSGARPGVPAGEGSLLVLGDGDTASAKTPAAPVRFLLLAAKPIGEPVARYGPFVMNTRAEIVQAVNELNDGTFLG